MAVILILLAVGERVVFDLGPNIELVTMATIVAALYLPKRIRLIVPLTIMAVSDWHLGVGAITWFTWSGFLAMALGPNLMKKWTGERWLRGLGAGLLGAGWFYLWTNLGVWLTDSWGMYPRDLAGLGQCYINALPFFKANLLSTMLFVPLGIMIVEMTRSRNWLRWLNYDSAKNV